MGAERYGDDIELTRATRVAMLRVGLAGATTVAAIVLSFGLLVLFKIGFGFRFLWQAAHWWAVLGVFLIGLVVTLVAFRRRKVQARRVRNAELLPDGHVLVAVLSRLCSLADMPRPRLALVDLPMRNAFVRDVSGDGATIYLSRAAAFELAPDETEAVLAHELFHVAHGDTRLSESLEHLADVADRKAPRWVATFVLHSVRTLLRQREHSADRAAVLLTGRPSSLVAALESCTVRDAPIRATDLREAMALGFVPQRSREFGFPDDTHPTVEQRTEVIARAANQLGTR
jgi:Zn-dependent protease with chaperone function